MLPRGGGAFVNEMDGNLACIKKDDLTVISQHGKYRDVYFHPITFLRSVKQSERLKTASGDMVWSVICHVATPQEEANHEFEMGTQDRQVLEVLAGNSTMTQRAIADRLFWILGNGEPDHPKVGRVLKRLKKAKLIDENNILTELGRERLKENKQNGANGKGNGNVLPLFGAKTECSKENEKHN
jgi:DNA-binding PadR family transcriptional regulator